ncbi:MAG: hypothetical protein ACRD59_17525 [Candidatus Acidiferrales bacterium]
MAVNFGLRVIYEHSNVSGDLIGPVMQFVPYVITYIVALFIMEYILRKNFRHFRIGLLTSMGADAQELPATFGRTVRVWWTYSWRTVLYRLVIMFAATIPLNMFLGVFTRLPVVLAVAQLLVAIAVDAAAGLFVIYSNILDEDFGDFRVCLLPLQKSTAPSVSATRSPVAT